MTSLDIHWSGQRIYYIMTKHLVDIDDEVLAAARVELGTETMKQTVNEALRKAGMNRAERLRKAFDTLARIEFVPRDELWR